LPRRLIYALMLLSLMLPAAMAFPLAIVNLDATANGQAAPYGSNPVNLFLPAGVYSLTPVGTAGGGTFDAWSAFSGNFNCLPDHSCEWGWDTSFDYSYGAVYSSTDNGTRWDSPEAALAHTTSVIINLAVGGIVSFGLNECSGCLGDNRGGTSIAVSGIPEPSTVVLLAAGLALVGSFRRRARAR
jgi:hypothetical protein